MFAPALLAATVLSAQQLAPLWEEPKDLETRDLVHGVGGAAGAPKEGETFRFESKESGGHSKGYYVYGADGRKWKVKTGDEAPSEVAVSRILWAIGYRQPVLYYLNDWRIAGGPDERPGPGRFRLVSDHDAKGEWAFDDNPFEGTQALNGLIVANLLFNNWDLAPSNNRIYEVGKERWYVVQDVGGSLGKTRWPIGTRNNIDHFESQAFVLGTKDGRVLFDYHARHKKLLKTLKPDDVRWACRLLGRLSDRQLTDAFRGAGYPGDVGMRYVKKIRSKIDEGLALK
ncbi:MAG TPA: hypothetical protein VJ826_09000 [Candidatus Polarisedimenticolaceae bacterium]|nr:hypothetical protein [Candidatus Polarisedimenticolaceae bacterium]